MEGCRRSTRRRLVPAAFALATAMGACKAEVADPVQGVGSASAWLTDCRVEGIPFAARCGEVQVPETPGVESGGRMLDLRVVVVPARGREPMPDPIFMLAGGPGQAATEVFGPVIGGLSDLSLSRDVVLVDQRGTGSSAPLDCPAPGDSLAERLDPNAGFAELAACREGFEADLTRYTTPIAMDDLDRVREALGYGQINLMGGSYGTRAALVYMRRHPERVRTAVLDGNAPPAMTMPLWFARDGQRAFDALVRDCAAEPGCTTAFPDPAGDFQRLAERMRQTPPQVTVRHPRTGVEETVTLQADMLTGGTRGLLYVPDLAALLPLAVKDALDGDYQPLVAQWLALSDDAGDTMSVGMMLSILCAEDIPRLTDSAVADATDGTFLGTLLVDQFRRACDGWPRAELPAGYWDPVTSDIPALVLSGDLDPVTPPSWGEEVAATLSASQHVVVPAAGHGTLTVGCVPGLLETFLDTANATDLDATCVEDQRRPPFFVDHAGPVH